MLTPSMAQSDFKTGISDFSVSGIDENLRSISAVERTWRSPALPDAVKLDLAALPGSTAAGTEGFLRGLDRDFAGETDDDDLLEDFAPPEPPVTFDRYGPDMERSNWDEIRVVVSDLAGEPAPKDLTVDAVQYWKKDAIERGLLERPANGKVDASWSPEFNSIAWEVAYDQYEENKSGDRIGATSVDSVMDLIGDWTSPSGLLSAATELDLWWDVGAIGSEWSTWSDKWRKVGDSDGVLDFAGNLVDAVTGPIDDVFVPIMNWALIGSGVGATANLARLGGLSARMAASGSRTLRTLYTAGKRFDDAMDIRSAANVGRLAEPSMLGARLAKSSGSGRAALGGAMAEWRKFPAVVKTKQASQLGMRLGFTSRAQDLLPGERNGWSIADNDAVAGFNERLNGLQTNPLAAPLEVAFAPYNIWTPGTFFRSGGEGLNVVSRAGRQAVAQLGNPVGRGAAGALAGGTIGAFAGDDGGDMLEGALIGGGAAVAAPWVGRGIRTPVGMHATRLGLGTAAGVGAAYLLEDDPDAFDIATGALVGASLVGAKSFWNAAGKSGRDTTRNGKYIGYVSDFLTKLDFKPFAKDQRVANMMHRGLMNTLDPERRAVYEASFQRNDSFLKAFADLEHGGNEDSAAAATQALVTMFSMDRIAAYQSGGDEGRRHLFRNKLIAQARFFDLDQPVSDILHDAARSAASRKLPDQRAFQKEFDEVFTSFVNDEQVAMDFIVKHNERALDLQKQLMSPEVIPDLHPDLAAMTRPEGFNLDSDKMLSEFEGWLIKDQPFQRWSEFTTTQADIKRFADDGLLNPATFMPSTGWDTGKSRRATFKKQPKPWLADGTVDDKISDVFLKSDSVDRSKLVNSEQVAPLAYINQNGRVTVARKGTPMEHEYKNLHDELKDLKELSIAFDTFKKQGLSLQDFETAAGVPLADITSDQIDAAIKTLGRGPKASVQFIAKKMKRLGRDRADFEEFVPRRISEIMEDGDEWSRYNLDRFARDKDQNLTGVKAIDARLKQLRKGQHYAASEIDTAALLKYWEEVDPARAEQVREMVDGMERNGYKLAHGVDFMMPHDLAASPTFKDMSRRNMHAATLGNFFEGRMPAEARAISERRQSVAVANQLRERAGMADITPDDARVKDLLADLQKIVEGEQYETNLLVDSLSTQNFVNRKTTAFKSNSAPRNIEGLQTRKDLVVKKLTGWNWTPAEAEAAFVAIKDFRDTEFKDLGLYAIEAKLRTRNELVQGLKFLSGTKHGDSILARSQSGALGGAAVGAAMGFAGADTEAGESRLGETLMGAGAGGAIGGVGQALMKPAGDSLVKGYRYFGGTRTADLMTYGYIGDRMTRLRDSLRFTMSPFFDISRYTEGALLNQVAAPLRKANGERVIMNLGASPRGIRRALKNEHIAKGLPADTAKQRAASDFDDWRKEFRQAASGDFDPEILDSTGKWFTQIGIMGFNPTDWMTGAFAQLRKQDIDPEAAYNHVRDIYTYGTRGRSAAEMSTNFIMFPFSFQKKTLGHMAKWMNDDLSRSIMIHDAYKAYEYLDEKYDLDELWRDHLPALNQLNRLNMFNFGISAGDLGGINAPYVTEGVKAAMGAFSPAGFSIKNAEDAAEIEDVTRSLLPMWNDVNWMVSEMKEQGRVVFSESHLTTRSEVSAAYEEWNDYKQSVQDALGRQGFTISDLQNKPYLADQKLEYELKRSELSSKYPAWFDSRTKSTQNRVSLEMEKADRLDRAAGDPANASVQDLQLDRMERLLEEARINLGYAGYDVGGRNGWEDAPPEVFIRVKQVALQMLAEDPRFMGIWQKYYYKQFGYLEAEV